MEPSASDLLTTKSFEDISVLLPVIDESASLKKTVEILMRDCAADIREFLILVCKKTDAGALAAIEELKSQYPGMIVVHDQVLPFVGGAYRESFDLASASHVLLIASDLETDPNDAAKMIAEAKKDPNKIICTSRWLIKGSFKGYNPLKLISNWAFQKFFCALYGTQLTDMTFGYRLFPTKVVQSIKWDELRHPFFFETIIKPIQLGVPVMEIPTNWVPRSEGESHNSFFRNFEYFRPGLKVRFESQSSLLRNGKS